jgi:hypothetical protein
MGTTIVWLADEEQRPFAWGGLPTSPRTALFAEPFLQAERWQHCTIEGQRTLEVRNANKDMGEQICYPRLVIAA